MNDSRLGGGVYDQEKAMISLFDLSTGMAGRKLLTDRSHRDGSPVRRNRSDVKRTADPAKVHVEGKSGTSERSSASSKSNATPVKMLLAKQMTKDVESKRKQPSVIARLMGLEDDLAAPEPPLGVAERDLRKSHSDNNLATANRVLRRQEQHHLGKLAPQDIHKSTNETVEYKDVYEVCVEPSRTHHFQDQILQRGRCSENKSDGRMEIVREKFMEAKRLATDEKLLHSKEFQEALEVLSSNRDLFLKFLEEPNSVVLRQLSGLHPIPMPPQTKRITVLKPIKSVESNGVRQTRTQVNEENGLEMRNSHKTSHSREVFSQPTRIVVLKPSPGKVSRTKARLTPHATPSKLINHNDFYGIVEDKETTLQSTEVMDGSIQHLQVGCHRRDESLLSSVYSNGYGGDESSLSRSEIDYIDEEGGNFSDSEVVSPVTRHSWDYIKRYGSPYSGSCFSRSCHSPESSVIREAKKRLSERWAMVTYNEISQEQVQLPRSSSTLGEMLSLQKKEEAVAGMHSVSSSRSCGTENELTTQVTCTTTHGKDDESRESSLRNLSRSKSVPVSSSMFDNIVVNAQASNSASKVVTRSDKGKSSLKGKVSNFFFSRSKKPTKEKATQPSDSSNLKIPSVGDTAPKADYNLDTDEKVALCEERNDYSTVQTSDGALKGIVSIEIPTSLDCPSENLDKQSNEGQKRGRDQPSPTSVLDAPFLDSNSKKPESSRSTTSSNKTVISSSTIESVSLSLSWEDTNVKSPSLGRQKLFALLSNVEDDELECRLLVQKIISSAGLDHVQVGMVFARWYLPNCPLDPALLDKFLDRKEEAAKSRERRSHQRLVFDCVNMALVEIGQNALLGTYPSSKARSKPWRETLSHALGVEVWSLVRDWLYGAGKRVASENDDAGSMMERIVKQEVEGRGWMKSIRSEVDEIANEIEGGVLEEMVREAVSDLATCFCQ